MHAAERRDGRMLRAQNTRPLARQAPRLAGAPSTALPAGDLEKKGPKQRLPRSGQLARRGHWRASGRESQRRGKGGGPAPGSHRTSQPVSRVFGGWLGDDLQKHTLPRRSGCCWRQLQTPAATGPLPMPSPCHRKRNEARSFGSLRERVHRARNARRPFGFLWPVVGQPVHGLFQTPRSDVCSVADGSNPLSIRKNTA